MKPRKQGVTIIEVYLYISSYLHFQLFFPSHPNINNIAKINATLYGTACFKNISEADVPVMKYGIATNMPDVKNNPNMNVPQGINPPTLST